jgi:serine phosphatase RsbU (regulator of sigma subunit)
MSLRYEGVPDLGRYSWPEFEGAIMGRMELILRMALEPATDEEALPPGLPAAPGYHHRVLFRPHGPRGGDWYGGCLGSDGSFWVVVFDVMSHGPVASLLARGLPLLWRLTALEQARNAGQRPSHILRLIHDELGGVLPEFVFVDAVLARFHDEAEVTVGFAGMCACLRRCQDHPLLLVRAGGTPLGVATLEDPTHEEEHWHLTDGEQVGFTSDGLLDQETDEGRLHGHLEGLILPPGSCLHQTLETLFQAAVTPDRPQNDDVTLVTIWRTH